VTRTPLPQRRRSLTADIEHRGQQITVAIGFDEAGAPREVFANGPKEGSDMQHILSDACVVISIALQCGVTPAALAHSLGTVPGWIDGREQSIPASPVGAILGIVMAEDVCGGQRV
jgi:hypothetical protein